MKLITKNKKKFDCGVVAVYNAASWCNLSFFYEDVEKIAKSCGYSSKGIYPFQFANLVKKLKLPAKKVALKNLEEVEEKLRLGRFFIFLYTPTGFDTGHIISLFMNHEGSIEIVNPERGRITWEDLISDIFSNGMKNFLAYEIPNRKLSK